MFNERAESTRAEQNKIRAKRSDLIFDFLKKK
jgi:hypothetical protein